MYVYMLIACFCIKLFTKCPKHLKTCDLCCELYPKIILFAKCAHSTSSRVTLEWNQSSLISIHVFNSRRRSSSSLHYSGRSTNSMSITFRTTPLQKLFLLLAGLAIIAWACIIASVPLNLPHEQEVKDTTAPGTENLNTGDTSWILICTVLGFFLAPTMAYLYANIYGKDEHVMVMVTLVVSTFITMLWIIMTFSLVYGDDANGQKFLGFPATFYMFRDVGAAPADFLAPTIPCSIYAVFELTFALLTPTIVAADIIDRVNVFGFIFFILVWHVLVYCPVAHIAWHPSGYLLTNTVRDFAGGIVVNMLASVTVLAAHVFLDYKKAPNYAVKIPNDTSAAFKSVLVAWFLWVGLNAGKAHDASPVAAQAIVNTIAAVQVSILFGYLLDCLYSDKLANSPVSMLSSILLGLVAVTPVCGFTTVGGAMFVTVTTVLATKLIARYALDDGTQPNDPLNLLTIHGIGGSIGFLMTGISSYAFINPAGFNGLTYGALEPIRMHTAATLALWSCAFLAVLVVLFVCDLVVPISCQENTERVFAPTLSYITPQAEVQARPKKLPGAGGSQTGEEDEEDERELEREASLYRKLSRYFSQKDVSGTY